ncbi:flagellar basal body protein FliL [Allokutzneria oryzae]|uniref:Flagellar basal body protein FliL n=1 Tax=Allokutzneria oryzae TaxID=1378989 RepID=A0ABV5ZSP1_9PSEU
MSTPGDTSGSPAQPDPDNEVAAEQPTAAGPAAEAEQPTAKTPLAENADMATPPFGVPQQVPQQPPQQFAQQFPQQGMPPQPMLPQPGPGQPPYGHPHPPQQGAPGPGRKRTGLVVGILVAVVALVAGGVTAFFAFSGSAGASTPTAAATKLVEALGKGDIAGVISNLAPAEAKLSADYMGASMDELKRLEVMKPDASPDQLAGVELKAEGLRFDEAGEEKLNDHVTVTKLTAGTITITSDTAKLPLADKFVDLAFPNGRVDQRTTETIDIASIVRATGQPVRIATVNEGGTWYASFFYSIADNALAVEEIAWPKEPIPANGAPDAETAVKELVRAALSGDLRRVVELLPPDEMGVLHDLGPLLVGELGGELDTGSKLVDLKTVHKDVNGGTKVSLDSMMLEIDGERGTVRRVEDCVEIQGPQGQPDRMCAKDVVENFIEGAEKSYRRNTGKAMPQQLKDFCERIVRNFLDAGVMTTQVDGKHYVSPIRTVSELMLTVLRSLEPKDVEELVKAGR